MNLHAIRFPIGELVLPDTMSADDRDRDIARIDSAPERLRAAIAGLSREQIDTQYRPEGWTIRQVVHHLPDSHVNSYARLKLALTEDTPLIRTYDEALWAELSDSHGPVDMSLSLLESLHRRWVLLWSALDDSQWRRELKHPDLGVMRVDQLLSMYAWHSDHHIAHITTLRERKGW